MTCDIVAHLRQQKTVLTQEKKIQIKFVAIFLLGFDWSGEFHQNSNMEISPCAYCTVPIVHCNLCNVIMVISGNQGYDFVQAEIQLAS